MKNHLFIGLGGFGGRTLADLRRCIHINQKLGDKTAPDDVRLSFLYFDTNDDIKNDKAMWTALGEDCSLEEVDFVNFRDGEISTSFESLDQGSNITPWLGERKDIDKYLLGAGDTPGANQRRRFGRFLFGCNAERFLGRVRSKVTVDGQRAECAFHIFATFAGGTGSGSLVDAITSIRKNYPQESRYPIFVYGYVTSRKEDGKEADVGFFYPNQYSVIRDLNGLMVGKFNPQVLTEATGEMANSKAKHLEAVYLITPENRSQVVFSKERQTKVVSEWVYQKVMAETQGLVPAEVQKAFTGEDILAEFIGEPDESGAPARSCRFGSIGISRWEIPEDESLEALTYDYSLQALNQFRFNNWDKASGYIDDTGASKDFEFLEGANLRAFEHWTLDRDDEEKTFEKEWESIVTKLGFNGNLLEGSNALFEGLDEHYRTGFRKRGVKSYFANASTERAHEKEETFRRHLEETINNYWLTESASLQDLIKSLKSAESWVEDFRDQAAKLQETIPDSIDKESQKIGLSAR